MNFEKILNHLKIYIDEFFEAIYGSKTNENDIKFSYSYRLELYTFFENIKKDFELFEKLNINFNKDVLKTIMITRAEEFIDINSFNDRAIDYFLEKILNGSDIYSNECFLRDLLIEKCKSISNIAIFNIKKSIHTFDNNSPTKKLLNKMKSEYIIASNILANKYYINVKELDSINFNKVDKVLDFSEGDFCVCK